MKPYITDDIKNEVLSVWEYYRMEPKGQKRVLKKIARILLMDRQTYIVNNLKYEIAVKHIGAGVYDTYLSRTYEEELVKA